VAQAWPFLGRIDLCMPQTRQPHTDTLFRAMVIACLQCPDCHLLLPACSQIMRAWMLLDTGGPSNSCGKTDTCHARSNAKEMVPLLVKMGKAALLGAFCARSFTFVYVRVNALTRA
jgi:hypothetical protein